MKNGHVLSLSLVLCLVSPLAHAESDNPFGFETQRHPLQYEYCKKLGNGKELRPGWQEPFYYICSSAPRVHPDINRLILKFVEDVGLCHIRALSHNVAGDNFLLSFVDGVKDQIVRKYGPPTSELKEATPNNNYRGKYRYDWTPKAGFRSIGNVVSISVALWNYSVQIDFKLRTSAECWKKADEMRGTAF